ncbi:uncharacterized protein BJX67DRAFT_343359 [Aspergillus lucknowensis]|uniref:Uncharacterized protein n=1 Tax=Aspergillus lucknowensis TaxID=176173 RepID=A0ABR4M367_9EURO
MKLSTLLLALLPLTGASPSTPSRWQGASKPLVGREITDPEQLSALHAMHADTLGLLNSAKAIPVTASTNLTEHVSDGSAHEKRIVQLLELVGIFVAGTLGSDVLQRVLGELLDVFLNDDIIWQDTGHCRAFFGTQGGGNEEFWTFARDHSDPTSVVKTNVGWNDPDNTDPPVHFFEAATGDRAIGTYSVQFTATDRVAWSGIPGTETCPFEGLCNPQYIFYHMNYAIILNTWQSQGLTSACQYSQGDDCRGVCASGVKDQFRSGGVFWGGDCAIPCFEDGGEGYIAIPYSDSP